MSLREVYLKHRILKYSGGCIFSFVFFLDFVVEYIIVQIWLIDY
jgi:hypothetical protein